MWESSIRALKSLLAEIGDSNSWAKLNTPMIESVPSRAEREREREIFS